MFARLQICYDFMNDAPLKRSSRLRKAIMCYRTIRSEKNAEMISDLHVFDCVREMSRTGKKQIYIYFPRFTVFLQT